MSGRTRHIQGDPGLPGVEEYQAASELREALRRFHRHSEQVARRHRLTPQRYELLLMIKAARAGDEKASMGELAERLHHASSTLSELVQRAEALGLVRREPGTTRGSRGRTYVRLTSEGEDRLAGAVADLAEDRRRLIAILSQLSPSEPARRAPARKRK